MREQKTASLGSHVEACRQMESLFAKKKSMRARSKALQDPVRPRGLVPGVCNVGEPAIKTVQIVTLRPHTAEH